MKKEMFIVLAMLAIVAAGCSQSGNQANNTNQATVDTANPVTPGNQITREITTPDGQKVTVTGSDVKGGWCQPGQKWNMVAGLKATTNMTFQGVMTEGKYAGYCHVVSVINAQGNTVNVDMYIKEDGSGYQVVNIGGKTYETEIKK